MHIFVPISAVDIPFGFVALTATWKHLRTHHDVLAPYVNARNFDFMTRYFVGKKVRPPKLSKAVSREVIQVDASDHLYPPVDKNFRIWEYIVQRFGERVPWLLRCDSDTLINFENLKIELNMYDADQPYYFGRPATGRAHERIILNLSQPYAQGACEIISRGAARLFATVLPCNRNRIQHTSNLHSDVEFSECLYQAGVKFTELPHAKLKFLHFAIAKPPTAHAFYQTPGITNADLTDAMLFSAAVVHPIKNISVMISVLERISRLKASRIGNVSVYWCDGGQPQRQRHMEAVLSGLPNVHRVQGPSAKDITAFQNRIPARYSNMSKWFGYARRTGREGGTPESAMRAFRGELGCTLSHLNAIRAAYNNGEPYALILEDDISFETLRFWRTDLLTVLAALPAHWDHLMLTVHAEVSTFDFMRQRWQNRNHPLVLPTADFLQSRAVLHSTGAYVISRQGMRKILQHFPETGEVTPCFKLYNREKHHDLTADNCLLSDIGGSAIGREWNKYVSTPVLLVDSRFSSSSYIEPSQSTHYSYQDNSIAKTVQWLRTAVAAPVTVHVNKPADKGNASPAYERS